MDAGSPSLVLTHDSGLQEPEDSDSELQQVDDHFQQQGMSLTREHLAAHDLQCRSYLAMIVDGNRYQFLESLIDQGEKGGLEAAHRLTEILKT